MKFKAYLFKVSKDKEGEVSMTFKVSKTEATDAMNIPVEQVLDLTVEQEGI